MIKWLFGGNEEINLSLAVEIDKSYFFRAQVKSEMKMNDMTLMKMDSAYLFEVRFQQQSSSYFVVDWNVTYKNMFNGMEYLAAHFELLQRILSIKDHLVLKVDSFGEIKQVMNNEELHAKWMLLKQEVMDNPEMIPIAESYREQFFKDGDTEFSLGYPLHNLLNEDHLFHTFFSQFALRENKYGNDIIKRTNRKSTFLKIKDQPLDIPSVQTSHWATEANVTDFTLSEVVDNSRLNKGKIRDILISMQMHDPALKYYQYDSQMDYVINSRDNMVQVVKNKIREKVNASVEMDVECEINQVYE